MFVVASAPRRRGAGIAAVVFAMLAGGCHLVLGLDEYRLVDEGQPSCDDKIKNGDETGTDCGGSCGPCPDGEGCRLGPDCASKVCSNGTCLGSLCDDKVKNGDEIDVDCGGSCGKCGPGQACGEPVDCKSSACVGGICESTCSDTVKGGDETDVDCGGSAASGCPGCSVDGICKVGLDCESGVCNVDRCVDFHVWSKSYDGLMPNTIPGGKLEINGLSVDPSGNIALAGMFDGAINMGGNTLSTNFPDEDIVVARFDSTGKHTWSKQFDGGPADAALGVIADTQGSVIVTGYVQGPFVNFGGATLPGIGSVDMFLIKYHRDGWHQWSKRLGGSFTVAGGVAVDGMDNIWVTGTFTGTVDFGGGPLVSTPSSGGDIFVAKYDSSGQHLWSNRFGDGSDQTGLRIVANAGGDVVVAGTFDGSVDFGGGPLVAMVALDVFAAKFSPSGAHVWSHRLPAKFIEVDSVGNTIVVGDFQGSVNLAGVQMTSAGAADIFVVKLDPTGKVLWSKQYGNDKDQFADAVTVDDAGNITFSGTTVGVVNFGGGPISDSGFVVRLDPSGEYGWSRGLVASRVSAIDAKHVLLVGQFSNTLDLGGGPLMSLDAPDIFLTKYRTQ